MKKIILLSLTSLVIFLFSCGSKSNKDVFVYAQYKEASDLDPGRLTDTASNGVIVNVCEGLVGYEGETDTHMVPVLAKSWDISNDGLTYTFHLREGVKFHDGTDFNADAVLFSLNRQQVESHPFYKKGAYGYWEGTGMAKNLKSLQKTDDHTVVLTLNQTDSTLLAKLAIAMSFIISPTAMQKMGLDEFDQAPVCTGAYVFNRWDKGQSILVDRNDNYWNKDRMPKVKKLIFKLIKDSSARLLALKKGEIDIAENIQPQDAEQVKSDSNLELVKKDILYLNYLQMNVDYAPLSNVKVRQAIAHLVDKQKIVDAATMGTASPTINPIPKAMWGYDISIQDYEYNVEEAKRLLAEGGYPNGFDMVIAYNTEDNARKAIAEILQNELAKVNIKATIQTMEWGSFLKVAKNREIQGIAISGWGADYIDPDNYLTMNFSTQAAKKPGLNMTGWSNAQFDDFNNQATRISDRDARVELYKKAQKIFHEEIPAIPVYDKGMLFGIRKGVKNFDFLPLTIPMLQRIEK